MDKPIFAPAYQVHARKAPYRTYLSGFSKDFIFNGTQAETDEVFAELKSKSIEIMLNGGIGGHWIIELLETTESGKMICREKFVNI